MNSNATQGTAGTAYGAAGAITVILAFVLARYGIQLTDAVCAAITLLLGYGIHWLAMVVIAGSSNGVVVTSPAVAASANAVEPGGEKAAN